MTLTFPQNAFRFCLQFAFHFHFHSPSCTQFARVNNDLTAVNNNFKIPQK